MHQKASKWKKNFPTQQMKKETFKKIPRAN